MNKKILIAFAATLLLCACSRAQAPREGLSNVGNDEAQHQADQAARDQAKTASAANAGPGEKFDPVEDEYISNETLKAWRHALAHDDQQGMANADWKALRIKDEEEAMASLKKLAEAHQSSYIKTMMGQVKQHFGKKEEAAEYYEEALLQNRKDPILIFKAAEMRRNSGNNKKALFYYRQVVKLQPDFPGAQLGIARCLIAEKDTHDEGVKIAEGILEKDPEDKDAKELLAKEQSGAKEDPDSKNGSEKITNSKNKE